MCQIRVSGKPGVIYKDKVTLLMATPLKNGLCLLQKPLNTAFGGGALNRADTEIPKYFSLLVLYSEEGYLSRGLLELSFMW